MKRILTCDGGGIRGIFTLQILKRIETMFRERENRQDLVLSDVIDFFAGTSTGAIIATCLSWGMTVQDIENMYIEHGPAMFARARWYQRFRAKYRADSMSELFREIFSEADGQPAQLGTDRLKTMLLVVMRNATTGSPWPISNNPAAMFNQRDSEDCNLEIPLWQLLRASTAAPTFYAPEKITIGKQSFLFVDGGISPYDNPSLLAVFMATLPSYNVQWPAGREKLHVISVGTGMTRSLLGDGDPGKINILQQVSYVPMALLESISDQQDLVCRVLGACVHGSNIDLEIGDLNEPSLFDPAEQKFTYARFNARLDVADETWLPKPLAKATLDDLTLIPRLQEIGLAFADRHVKPEHLDAA
jgi:hypothetical protein